MDSNDYLNILDTCKRYGNQDSNLWIQALQYFSKCEEYNCKEFIMQIITNIEKLNLLQPLMVIKILSQNSTLTIDTVKVSLFYHKNTNTNLLTITWSWENLRPKWCVFFP